MLRKVILNIHIYAGLLCFGYLIVFGVSSLSFNHPAEFLRARGEPRTWEQSVDLATRLPRVTSEMTGEQRVAAKAEANHAVRQALGLFAHHRPWQESWWDERDASHYHASLVRPGVEYDVDVHLDRKLAVVKETRTSAWDVIAGLHGFHGEMPGSRWVSTWSWYTELCTFAVLFAGVSGVYLWTRRRRERRIGFVLIGGAGAISLALMFYLTLHG
jgi:hypothetical protein